MNNSVEIQHLITKFEISVYQSKATVELNPTQDSVMSFSMVSYFLVLNFLMITQSFSLWELLKNELTYLLVLSNLCYILYYSLLKYLQ